MSEINKVSELPCSSDHKNKDGVHDAIRWQEKTFDLMREHIGSVDETSTNEGSVMSENNIGAEQPGSSTQNNEDINQGVVEKKRSDDLASNSSSLESLYSNRFEYTPYDDVIKHTLRFHEKAEFLIRSKNGIAKPLVYINTGIAYNIISLKLATNVFRLRTEVKPLEKIIESYLPGHRTAAVGTCLLSIKFGMERNIGFHDVEFLVVDDEHIPVMLGTNFFHFKLPEVILDVHGLIPPITAYGKQDKVILRDVNINGYYEIDEVRLDTGCKFNLISRRASLRAFGHCKKEDKHIYFPSIHKCLHPKECCFVNVVIGYKEYRSMKFYVMDHIAEDMVLGMDFVLNHQQVYIKYDVRENDKNFKMNIAVKHPVEEYGPDYKEPEETINCFTKMFRFLTCSQNNDAEGAEVHIEEKVKETAKNQEKQVKHTNKEDSLQEVDETSV